MSFVLSPRHVLVALAIAGAVVAILSSLGGTASAGGGPVCPEKALCVYEHDGWDGQRVVIKTKGISNKLAKKMNNEASSAFNNRGKRAFLYDKRNGKGDKVCISAKGAISSLGAAADFNDRASSSRNVTKKQTTCPLSKS